MNATRAEEERLLELLYLCPTAILKIDGSGRILMLNAAGARIMMPAATNATIENLYDFFQNAAPELRRIGQDFPERSGRVCDEYRVLVGGTSDRIARSYVFSITLHKIDDDTLIAVIADVTSTVMREDVVRANEKRLQAVFDGVRNYGIATFDLNGIVTSWNHAAEEMDGYPSSEVIGGSGAILLPATSDDASGAPSVFERAQREGSCVFENWRIRKDGTRYWANSAISVMPDRDGEGFLGYSMITRNVSDRKLSYDRLHRLAETDPLTGALNRRAFFEAALRSEEPYRERGVPAAVLMLDVDHFKSVNDRFGHDAGDAVLRSLVTASCKEIRSIDSFARYGGEEFILLLPGSDVAGATRVAERIRANVAAMEVEVVGTDVHVTVSIGVAALAEAHADIASTITAADGAMYAAKRHGRNRVVAAA